MATPFNWAMLPRSIVGLANRLNPVCALWVKMALALRCRCVKAVIFWLWVKIWKQEFARLQKTLPLGMQLQKVSDQPVAVKHSVNEFMKVLAEAVIIVLLVSFFSLGFRTGLGGGIFHSTGLGHDLCRYAFV